MAPINLPANGANQPEPGFPAIGWSELFAKLTFYDSAGVAEFSLGDPDQ